MSGFWHCTPTLLIFPAGSIPCFPVLSQTSRSKTAGIGKKGKLPPNDDGTGINILPGLEDRESFGNQSRHCVWWKNSARNRRIRAQWNGNPKTPCFRAEVRIGRDFLFKGKETHEPAGAGSGHEDGQIFAWKKQALDCLPGAFPPDEEPCGQNGLST